MDAKAIDDAILKSVFTVSGITTSQLIDIVKVWIPDAKKEDILLRIRFLIENEEIMIDNKLQVCVA